MTRDENIEMSGHCEPRFESVRAAFADSFMKTREVGAAISFTLHGESVVDLWAGHVDKAKTRAWQPDTIVNTYSTTKGMTAICAHQLVERGELDLDAPVSAYWPEFAAEGKAEVPVRWLLSHQVGLPAIREPLPDELLFDARGMAAALAAERPWWTPGTKHGYHPVTFGFLVGEVIQRVSGESVGTWFRKNVAEPLEADFHIGLPEQDDARVTDLLGSLAPPKLSERKDGDPPQPRIKGPLADFMRDMTDRSTMVGAAFSNPRQKAGTVNTRAWRGAEIPAANGHGNARALARIYGALACGGAVDGIQLLEPASIDRARTEQASGPDATLANLPIRYGLGFMLRSDTMPLSPNPGAFGHPGAGGSLGMADPETGVGFGYVMNQMKPGLMGGATAFAAIRAFFDAL